MSKEPSAFRIPPQETTTEKHILGAMMLDRDAVATCASLLKTSDFYLEKHQILFDALLEMAAENISTDILTLSERLRKMGLHDQIGGDDFLMGISTEVISAANVEDHAEIVKEKATLRNLIKVATQVLESSYNAEMEPAAILDRAESDLGAVRASSGALYSLRRVPKQEATARALEAYDAAVYHGESTGWLGIDQLLRVSPGQLNIVTGPPNHGKSSWLDALMLNLSLGCHWRVGYFSPENSPLHRHLQQLAEKCVEKRLYGDRRMSREEYSTILDRFIMDRFEFLDQGLQGATLDQVLSEFARMRPKIQACVIDPWNRLEHPRRRDMNETDYVRDCLRRAQRFAQSTGISTWIVAHPAKLQRDKNGEITKPGLYDISGSAHFANICDNGLMIWRDYKEKRTEVHVLKVRFKDNGHPGMMLQKYNTESGRFTDYTEADHFASNQSAAPRAPRKNGKNGALAPDAGKQIEMMNQRMNGENHAGLPPLDF